MIIYKVTNIINNKSYIGKTVFNLEERKLGHFRHAFKESSFTMFHRALRKYGKEYFEWCVLCKCKSIEELNRKEIYFIKNYRTFIEELMGYNMTKGGTGGDYLTCHPDRKNICKKLSDSKRGNRNHRYGKLGTFLGKFHTLETRNQMSLLKKGRYNRKNNPNWKGGKINSCIMCNKKICNSSKMCMKCYAESIVGKGNPVYGKNFKQNIVKCPHCEKMGGVGNMKRYHFDNCKEKDYE